MPRVAKKSVPKHWRVRFTRRGMEPPMPFGKTTMIVCATSRSEAKEAVPASPRFPVTASETSDPVTWPNRCRHEEAPPEVAAEPRSSADLDRDIDEALRGDG